MTFNQWWSKFSNKYSLDDSDSLKTDFHHCWETAMQETNKRLKKKMRKTSEYAAGYEDGLNDRIGK